MDEINWEKLCKVKEIPENSIREFNIDGITLLLVKGDSNYLVIPPVCPHMEQPLRDAICNENTLTCIEHLWQFDLKTGNPIGEAERGLLVYKTKEKDGEIFVYLEKELVYEYQVVNK